MNTPLGRRIINLLNRYNICVPTSHHSYGWKIPDCLGINNELLLGFGFEKAFSLFLNNNNCKIIFI